MNSVHAVVGVQGLARADGPICCVLSEDYFAYPGAHADTRAFTHADALPDANADSNANADSSANADADSDAGPDTHSDADTDAVAHTDECCAAHRVTNRVCHQLWWWCDR